ncbi:MAG: hypothetical protein Q9183_001059 [Haloplaca sp. 2 TL-2023]
MAAYSAAPPCLQMMRTEFKHSLQLRNHLKTRRLFSSKPCVIPQQRNPAVPQRLPSNEALSRLPWRNPARQLPSYRDFSASSRTSAAVVTANPRKDEDGNEMVIDITERASTRLQEIMAKDSNSSLALRVSVESGGCHGFQYLMSLTDLSAISPEDDTVFEASNGSGAKVVMDEPSLELLKGSKVDFTMELIGSQFKIVGNPAASSSCGCGTSFDIKPA